MQDHFGLLLTDGDFLLVTKPIFTMAIAHQTLSEKNNIFNICLVFALSILLVYTLKIKLQYMGDKEAF